MTPKAAPRTGGAFGMLLTSRGSAGLAQHVPTSRASIPPLTENILRWKRVEKTLSVLFAVRTLQCMGYGKRDIGNQPLPTLPCHGRKISPGERLRFLTSMETESGKSFPS